MEKNSPVFSLGEMLPQEASYNEAIKKLIDVFRNALDGDPSAKKMALEILDHFQDYIENFSEEDYDEEEDYDYTPYKVPTLKRATVQEFHIRIQLCNIELAIWREIKVPSNIALDFLARVLIDVMGWTDEHLCEYSFNKKIYVDDETADESFANNVERMWKFSLSDLLTKKKAKMTFTYDFGDNWKHEITLLGIRDYEKGERKNIVWVDGEGACPFENCGGTSEYERLVELTHKKRHTREEKEEMVWYEISKDFDPTNCDKVYKMQIIKEWNMLLHKK